MKKIIFLLLVLTMTSCGFVKWVTNEYKQEKVKAKTEVKTSLHEKDDVKITDKSTTKTDSSLIKIVEEIERKTEEFEARLLTYDTEKPADPGTGRPPVASELIYTNKTSADKKLTENVKKENSEVQKNDIQIDYKHEIRRVIDSVMAENRKTITKTESKTGSGTYWYWWVLIGAGLTVLIYYIFRNKLWKMLSFLLKFFQ